MPFYSGVLNTNQYEVVSISDSVDTIPSGTAVKVSTLPTASTTPYSYFQVSKASSTDTVFGIVAKNTITDTQFGRVILLNSGLTPVLMNETLLKGAQIKVTTADGKFGQVTSGQIPIAILTENSSVGNLAWAQVLNNNTAETVTSVSGSDENGIVIDVATPTTTPKITIELQNITPISVSALGTVTGQNLSGNNTGDQINISGNAETVTTNANLSGDVSSIGNVSSYNNIVPKTKGGFGQNVSTGLTNGNIAIVSGGTMTIGANPNTSVLPLTLYVNGSVVSTGNGSFQLPFKTIAEALAVAVANTVIYISSGTYTENLTLPNIDNLTIIGASKNSTIITAVAASSTPTLQWAPLTGAYTKLTIRQLALQNTNNGQLCLSLDGNGTAIGITAQFLTSACILDNVICDKVTSTGDGWYFRTVDKLFIHDGNGTSLVGNVAGWNCSGRFDNPGYTMVSNTLLGNGVTGFTLTYDNTPGVIKPNQGRQGVNLLNGTGVYGTTTISKSPILNASQESAFYGDIIGSGMQIFSAPFHAPVIVVSGYVGTAALPAAVTLPMPATTNVNAIPYVDFSGATIWGSAAKPFTVSSAVGIIKFSPIARNARFEGTAASSVIAGAETNLDIRKSYFTQAAIASTGNGAIDRDSHVVTGVVSPGSVTFSVPFPTGATYSVAAEPTTAVAIGVTTKTVTGFSVLGAGTVTLRANRTT